LEGDVIQQPAAPFASQPALPDAQPTPAPQAQPEQKAPDLARKKKLFEESRDLTQDARTESLTDCDYYDSEQLSDTVKKALRNRKQPELVINRVKPAINGILGVVQRGKSEPRAWPRTPKDEDSADVATDALRYIGESNRFDDLKLDVFKDILVPGTGAAIVEIDADKQVTVKQVRWEEFFYDARSRRADFDDARVKGIAKWMYADDVAAMYKDKSDEIDRTVADGSMGAIDESFTDRPQGQSWVDRRNRRLMVVEMYEKEGGEWTRCVFHSGGWLEYGPSPYLDHKGRPTCPIEAQSAYVTRNNDRYGAVRDMRGPQDEVNKRRSKSLHMLSTRQLEETQPGAATINPDLARAEAARPDGIIPAGYRISPNNDVVSGHMALLQEAKAEIERLGPNPAILGREGADSSGRALLARQQSGLVELAILFGALEDWELRIYRQMWARARQFWTDPMWIRVTDDEGSPKFVQLNEPQMGPGQVVQTADGQIGIQPQVLGYKNQVAEMDVDIIIDATPDTANLQQEQFQDLVQIVGSNPVYAQQVPFEMLLELSAVPHKRQMLDKLKGYRVDAQKAQAAASQQQQQIATAGAQAKIENIGANTQLTHAKGILTAVQAQKAMDAPVMLPGQGSTGFDPSQASGPPAFQNGQ
jgi:hypothetical protein